MRLVQGNGTLHLRRPRRPARLAGYTLLQADVTANTDDDKALLARFGLFGPPGIIFFNAQGQENKAVRIVGFQDAAQFQKTLRQLEPV